MEIIIDIPENKAPFVMELLKNLTFLKIRKPESQDNLRSFRDQWANLSGELPQGEPDITEEEILAEVRAVRANRSHKS